VTSDLQGPDGGAGRTAVEPAWPADDAAAGRHQRPPTANRPGAYWTGLVVLAAGLAVTVLALATRVTSLVQTVLLAVPLALVGIGLERVGRGVGRASLRSVGAVLAAVAVVGPLVLSLSPRDQEVTASLPGEPVPAGAANAELRASMGGGRLQVEPGASGLYTAELRGPGQPSARVTTAGDLAVLDLRAPAQRGMLARNRGNDWRIRLNTSLAWQVDLTAGSVTADRNLRDLALRGVTIQSGVSRLALRLGEPATEVAVNLQVSTGLVDLYLPRAAALEVAVEGLSTDNFGDQGLTRNGEAWRADGTSAGRYRTRIRTSGARIRIHRE
jgi:hypothetical protein